MLKDFFLFLCNPTSEFENVKISFKYHVNKLINGFPLYFFAVIVSAIIIGILNSYNLMPISTDKLKNMKLSFYLFVIIPILEESIFRLPLRFSRFNISSSLSIIVFVLIHFILKIPILYSLLTLPLLLFLSLKILTYDLIFNRLFLFWRKHFIFLFYTSTLLFGIMHLFNHIELELVHYLLAPFITIYQVLLGLILGYFRVRFKYGFIYCSLLHILFNIPGILLIHYF